MGAVLAAGIALVLDQSAIVIVPAMIVAVASAARRARDPGVLRAFASSTRSSPR